MSLPTPSLAAFLSASLRRQLLLAYRRPVDTINPLLFFLLVVTLFPLGIGPDPAQLAEFAPGILWIVALLASLMAAEGMFRQDYEDGSLEQLLLSPQPLYLASLTYSFAHWLVTGVPLTLLSPLFATMLQLPVAALPVLLASMALGTAILSLVGSIGAALTVSLKRGGMLISLIIVPLYIPVLIFAAGAVRFAAEGFDPAPQLLLLAGMLSLSVALAPFAISAGLRISVDAG
ncbi:MAG: heme exporter protein CcmB [Halieaceae bacterium]|nr:heme exporter protein CcmB [Halieaceae bacterium]